MAEEVIAVRGLVKSFGRVRALRAIDFEVAAGEVFGFLGPNGAGKTTTIRCLLGMLQPTAGRVTCFGLDATRDGVRVRKRIAYVPGELRLPERMTGAQLIATIAGVRGGLDSRRRDDLVERLQVDLHSQMRTLSTGNRRKLALLLAFSAGADLFVLDEPTNGLDPLMQREFLSLVREAVAGGATVFLSSHVLSEIQRVADRVAILRAGEVIAYSTVEELRQRARQRLEIWFEDETPSDLASAANLQDIRVHGRHLTATLSGPIQPLIDMLAQHHVASMLVESPDLEDAFLDLYQDGAG